MSLDKSDLLFDSDARSAMIRGVCQLAEAVSITLGPKGKNVAIYKEGRVPHLTKDGVTVANAINLSDPFENLGAQLVKEAAQRSAEVAGDGTTTSTVIAHKLLVDGARALSTGLDVRDFVSGIEHASSHVLEKLQDSCIEIDGKNDLLHVATISANGDKQIGSLIADAIDTVGEDGAISVEPARGFDTSLEIVDGTVVDRGFLSPYFVTDQSKNIVEMERVAILLYNQTLNSAQAILPALEAAAASNQSLLIIANDVASEALQTLVLNKMKGALSVCAVKAPEFGAARTIALQDLAAITGAEVIVTDDIKSIKENCSDLLGSCQKVVVDKNGCILIGTDGNQEEIQGRIDSATDDLESPATSIIDREVAKRRIRRLSKGIGVIRVGGATEVEMFEKKDRIDDALHAARAAKKSGTQPGGGSALFYSAQFCKSQNNGEAFNSGYSTLLRACREPLRKIVENSGAVPDLICEKMTRRVKQRLGYDAKNAKFENMRETKILDPHLVVVSSLQHAVSVACNILLVGCSISLIGGNEENLGLIEKI